MELWIPITIAAAFLQNLRSALQKHLKGSLSTGGATFSRFLFGAPFAVVFAVVVNAFYQGDPLHMSPMFFVYTAIGGIGQILGTGLLVSLFSHRNFAVGTAYSKTETVQTVFFGVVILGETVSNQAFVGILIALIGVIAISFAQTGWNRNLLKDLFGRTALTGMASGTCFAVSAVLYRKASLSLGGEGFLPQSSMTLAVVLVTQTIMMSVWLKVREPGQAWATFKAWRVALPAGISGFAASACWFAAMTLETTAYVRALGQVELVFTFLASWFVFKEKSKLAEVVGVVLICGGILVLILR